LRDSFFLSQLLDMLEIRENKGVLLDGLVG
jgi:hypothetical protein